MILAGEIICRLVVCDGGFFGRGKAADQKIPMDMYFCGIFRLAFRASICHPLVGIEDFDIAVAEIIGISVGKSEIYARAGKVADAISGVDVGLHAVLCHE